MCAQRGREVIEPVQELKILNKVTLFIHIEISF